MDREMRRQYTVLVDFLGHILGPDYEVALHELKDDSNEIIAIANGELTGRHLGLPPQQQNAGVSDQPFV